MTGETKAISRFTVPQLAELPQDIRARIEEVSEKSGFIPNVFLVLARRPHEFRAFFAYHDSLLYRESGLSKAEKEMIVVVTSAMNDCQYCVVAHGAILRIRDRNPLIADQIAINYLKADLSERQVIMLKLALKIASSSGEVTDADLDEARTVGFDEEDLWDIGAITAFFALSNRMANFSSMRPNDEFYDMGRNSPQ
ncbi:MAG: peroxidase-related enzyme [Proteobacteria bacterium]|nr:peroxidase-related enzyme [Pseudomonadota bacterium]